MAKENNPSNDGDPSVRLQIDSGADGSGHSYNLGGSASSIEPMPTETNTWGTSSSFQSTGGYGHAPEKKLTLFALRLAVLEKAATGLGTLGFIWATVVLLGGFAITIDKVDFWLVTTILLIEGARIFSRSRELEWQHQATWSLTDAGRHSFRAIKSSLKAFKSTCILHCKPSVHSLHHESGGDVVVGCNPAAALRRRTWYSSDVPLVPYAGWVFLSRNISRVLYWLQLLSATACVALSVSRIIQQDYGEISKGDSDKRNRKSALNIFYGLALAEALLFLTEKAYWEWKVSFWKLLDEVNKECGFGVGGLVSVRRFFYDAYSKCVNGSIFDGLKMDLISFAEELLDSTSYDEQLIGARILQRFATSDRFAGDTLRKIGTSTVTMERLVEMLNWKNPSEVELRRAAAEVVSKLAGKKQNALRVAWIPGSMEAISSLLYAAGNPESNRRPANVINEVSAFNLLGLLILKKLAHDHDNCGKIGNTRGLLPKIIEFTSAGGGGASLLQQDCVAESWTKAMKRSLQVVKMLASATGPTGKMLRQEISEIVFTISNIREILQYGDNHMMLQKLAIEILTSLAMDEEARRRIGCTGGIIRYLFIIFFRSRITENQNMVVAAAGEALTMLALESTGNCGTMLRVDGVVERLTAALDDPVLRVNSARILRNLCAFSGEECSHRLRGVIAATPTVLRAIMKEEEKLLEVSIGLTTQIFQLMRAEEIADEFENAGIREGQLAEKLVQILRKYNRPSIKVPEIRRFIIELAIWMMRRDDGKNIRSFFRYGGMERELKNVADTTSELEFFNVFSGSVGLSRHRTSVWSLVDCALETLL